jgi:predicted CopG family antitoxin
MTKQVSIDLSDDVYKWLDERRRALKLKNVAQVIQQLIDERRLMGW